MLASVAGAIRRSDPVAAMAASSAVATATLVDDAIDPPPPSAPARPAPAVLRDVDPEPDGWDVADEPAPPGQLMTWPQAGAASTTMADGGPNLGFEDDPDGLPLAHDDARVADLDDSDTSGLPVAVRPSTAAPVNDAYAAALAAVRQAPVEIPAPVRAPEVTTPVAEIPTPARVVATAAPMPAYQPAAVPPPGSYVPPVLEPAAAPAPARSWAGHGAADPAAGATVAVAVGATADATSDDDPSAATTRQAKAVEFVGWLAIAGAALSLAGFLLPWSSIAVIGADGIGYFDRWGLAGPWHVLVVAGLIGLLVAAILRERVPMWLGIGLPGLGLGALLVGLLWPYLLGPLEGSLGAMAVGLGALLLIGAGIAAIVVDRHGREMRPV
jgi:hypothetical protein